ncbi:DUF905 family protein [Pantoea sp. App145]|uniref:DUF905 family protein n=1 Tax=Pantoea sp. App145 TaxID=3071567 RepID=UPI003A7FB1DD
MTTTRTGIITEMRCVAALGNGMITREQAVNVTAAFSNVYIDDDQGSHFRLVVCEPFGSPIWSAYSFDNYAGNGLRKYINSWGIRQFLSDQLTALTDLNDVPMTLKQRRESMARILNDLASAAAQRVPDNPVVIPAACAAGTPGASCGSPWMTCAATC